VGTLCLLIRFWGLHGIAGPRLVITQLQYLPCFCHAAGNFRYIGCVCCCNVRRTSLKDYCASFFYCPKSAIFYSVLVFVSGGTPLPVPVQCIVQTMRWQKGVISPCRGLFGLINIAIYGLSSLGRCFYSNCLWTLRPFCGCVVLSLIGVRAQAGLLFSQNGCLLMLALPKVVPWGWAISWHYSN